MKQTGKLALLFIALTTLITSQLQAQLYGVGFDKANPTMYSINRVVDKIYGYNETPANWNTKSGTLKAITPDSTKGWTCMFQVFDMTTKKILRLNSFYR